MSQLDTIKQDLHQSYDTNILRVGFMADSIWSSVGDFIESDGSHPPYRMRKNSFYRQAWDSLNYNKPIFRSITHSDWVHSGGSQINAAYPDTDTSNAVRLLNSDSDSSIIQITGKETIVFWFEGGESGKSIDTGTVKIEVSTNGIDYVNPSTLFDGKKQNGRIGDTLGYDSAINELVSNLTFPSYPVRTLVFNNYVSWREIQYNNLNPSINYYFKITRKAGTNGIRLGGCYYFTGKTLLFMNFAVPGSNQAGLISEFYNTIDLHDIHYLIIQSTIYHDYYSPTVIENYYKKLIREAKRYCTRLIFCSCTPAAVVIEDSETSQGDEAPAYVKGQNVQKEFNHSFAFNLSAVPAYADYPSRDAVYRCTINSVNYDLVVVTPKPSEANYATWYYKQVLRARIYTDFPIEDVEYNLTFTKQSGDGVAILTGTSRFYLPMPADQTRDLVRNIAHRYGVQFIDFYQLFADLAIANGETIETDGYPVQESSPLYADYPDGMENYLSRYFRPNHWNELANSPVYQKLMEEFFNSFKYI